MGTKFLSVLTSVAVLIGIFSGPVVSAKANTAEGLEYNIANGQAIITKYTGNAADLVIPDTIQEYPVTEIYDQAFHNCTSLKNITIPAGVKRIGIAVFPIDCDFTGIWVSPNNTYYSNDSHGVLFNKDKTQLIRVPCGISGNYTIPSTVKTIGTSAFSSCSNLESVTIPNSVTNISQWPFSSCDSLTGIWVDSSNPNYSSDSRGVLFNKDKSQLIQAPGAIIGSYTIPSSVKIVGWSSFADCAKLKSVNVSENVEYISDYAFVCCAGLESVTIGNRTKKIGWGVFSNCTSLNSITIGKSVEIIGNWAFEYCQSLQSITIPHSVISIGELSFMNCPNLKSIAFEGNPPTIGYDAFYEVTATAYYPAGNTNWTADVMQDYGGSITWRAKSDTVPGDLNGDDAVNNTDVAYLLWYTLFPGDYPITSNVDFNSDGIVNNKDVAYLLWHTLFPEDYPI